MSDQQLSEFLEKIKQDNQLRDIIKSADTLEKVIAIADREGFKITVDDLQRPVAEVSEQELERVAAGGYFDDSQQILCQKGEVCGAHILTLWDAS